MNRKDALIFVLFAAVMALGLTGIAFGIYHRAAQKPLGELVAPAVPMTAVYESEVVFQLTMPESGRTCVVRRFKVDGQAYLISGTGGICPVPERKAP